MKVRDTSTVTVEQVVCPVCGAAWCTTEDPTVTPCKHLRFAWFQEGPIQFFGRWNKTSFKKAYLKAAKNAGEEDPSLDENPCHEALEKMVSFDVEEVLVWTETGMACGPVSFSTYFGVKP